MSEWEIAMEDKIKITSLEKMTDTKFLNLYRILFDVNGNEVDYYVVSRRNMADLKATTSERRADVVRIAPYVKMGGTTFAVVTKEYRFPIADYVYSTPAGNIDSGETPEQAAERELLEEVGAKVKQLVKIDDASYSSVGMSDETVVCFAAEVETFEGARLEASEFITYELVPMDKLMEFTNEKVFDLQARLILKTLAYEWKLKKYNENELEL